MTKCYLCDGDAPPADAGRPPVCERCAPMTVTGVTLSEWMEYAAEHQKRTLWPEQVPQPIDDFIVPEAVKQTAEVKSTCARCGRIVFHWKTGIPSQPPPGLDSDIADAQGRHALHCSPPACWTQPWPTRPASGSATERR